MLFVIHTFIPTEFLYIGQISATETLTPDTSPVAIPRVLSHKSRCVLWCKTTEAVLQDMLINNGFLKKQGSEFYPFTLMTFTVFRR